VLWLAEFVRKPCIGSGAGNNPGGTEGNGSSAEVGMLTLFAADGTTKVAEVDASLGGDISPPGNVADTYFLSVERKGTTAGARDFYFLMHNGTAYDNTAEVEPNDVYGQATSLTAGCKATTVGTSCFGQGTLAPGGADTVDHFRFTAEAGQLVSVACGAQRSGSGLRGLSLKLLDGSDGTDIANTAAGPEADDLDLLLEDASVGSVTDVVLELTATSQAVDVTSNFYRCGIHLQDP
jgi:hypothetical protein